MLYVTMGISGSGKSTWVKNNKEQAVVVCPDSIRKELTNNINDQTRNGEVFRIAYNRVEKYLSEGKDVIFDSTALAKKTRMELIQIAKKHKAPSVIVVFMTSLKPLLCLARVTRDIENGVDRANTSQKDIIQRMHDKFVIALPEIMNEGWTYVWKE